jgi:hypothetical protein
LGGAAGGEAALLRTQVDEDGGECAGDLGHFASIRPFNDMTFKPLKYCTGGMLAVA